MSETGHDSPTSGVLGQKYAYATAALLVGIASFISLLGAEKAILAVVFGVLALKARPEPVLRSRRRWAQTGLALGIVFLVFLPVFLVIYRDRLYEMLTTLQRMS
jgi:hypothetical protein